MFVCEAVFVYLAEEQVRTVLSELAHRFEGSGIAFDTAGAVMLRNQHRNGSMHAVAARMQWVCEDPRELEQRGLKLLQTRTFATPQPEIANSWPARYRAVNMCAARARACQRPGPEPAAMTLAASLGFKFVFLGEANGVDPYSPGRVSISR